MTAEKAYVLTREGWWPSASTRMLIPRTPGARPLDTTLHASRLRPPMNTGTCFGLVARRGASDGRQPVELADAVDPIPIQAPVGRSRSPVPPDHRRDRDFDPFTEGRGLRRINRLDANAARL
jgi:hypothetical protein